MSELSVGMELYWPAPGVWAMSRKVKILKVGRKWLTLENDRRIDKDTLRYEGNGHQLYRSEEEYNTRQELLRIWSAFGRAVGKYQYTPPADVETIRKAAEMLGLDLTPVSR